MPVHYRLGGELSPPVLLTVWQDGRARLDRVRGEGVESWSARLDPVVWPRLLAALRDAGFPEVRTAPAPAGAVLRELAMIDQEPAGEIAIAWDDAAAAGLAEAFRILDALVVQVASGVERTAPDLLPRIAHRSAKLTPDAPLGRPEAAAFGPGPVLAVARAQGTLSLYGERPGPLAAVSSPVRAVAVDGDLVAAAGDDGVIRVWDAESRKRLHDRTGHGGPVWAVAADGDRICSAGTGCVRSWPDGAPSAPGTVNALAVTADGLVTGGDDGVVRAGDRELDRGPGWVTAVAASGGLVAGTGPDGLIRVWDQAGDQPRVLAGHGAGVTGLAFLTADRPMLASCSFDGTVRTWDPFTGDPARVWSAQDAWPAGLACGEQVLVTGGGAVRVWDVRGRLLLTLSDGQVARAVATRGDLVAAGFHDGTVRLFDLRSGEPMGEAAWPDGAVTGLAFAGDDRLVCGTDTGTVRVHELPGLGVIAVPTPHGGPVHALALDGGVLVSGGADGYVRTWDARSGLPYRRMTGHAGGVTAVVAGGGLIVSGGYDRTVRVWDGATGRAGVSAVAHALPVYALALGTIEGRRVIASGSSDGNVPIWDAGTGERVALLRGNPGTVRSLCLDGDMLAAGFDDGRVRTWRVSDRTLLGEHRLQGPVLALTVESGVLHAGGPDGLIHLD
ncbi:WD40 repeat domain-containing protein [Nonomuraea sp. NPDC050536]|uniref:WD40 repeat domain-containing protein n=1 Tax=Nonomuraea sp. NPDC050536 TaxID=3364366 RepID=UPI0037CC777F